jgi:hypothetical protein
MKIAAIVVLLLAAPLVAQTSRVRANAASKSFDELYEVAPECRNTVVDSTTLGPGHDTTFTSVKTCQRQEIQWLRKVEQDIKTGATMHPQLKSRSAVDAKAMMSLMKLIATQRITIVKTEFVLLTTSMRADLGIKLCQQ